MADENTLKIVIEDEPSKTVPASAPNAPRPVDIRHNPDLDEFMNGGSSSKSPAFPNTVMGKDGKTHSIDAYDAARKRFDAEEQRAAVNAAYKQNFAKAEPPPLPKKAGEAHHMAPMAAKEAGGLEGMLGQIGGSALKAAGPLAIAGLAASALTKSLNGMRDKVDAVNRGMESAIANQYASPTEMAGMFAKGMSDSLKSIPIVGELAASQMELQQAVLSIPDKLTTAFLQQAKQIAPYSGEISAADARAEVRKIQGDIREAQELGTDMARLVDAQSRFEAEWREIMLPIKRFLIEVLAERLEMFADGARTLRNLPDFFAELQKEGTSAIVLAITGEWTKAGRKIEELPGKLASILGNSDPITTMDLFTGLYEQFDRMPGRPEPNVQRPGDWLSNIGLPIIGVPPGL